ncbi:TPA: hypothetical protein ACKQDJ_004723 [Serratia marcescens]|nr:hypothetical protein [Serratia marcescens]
MSQQLRKRSEIEKKVTVGEAVKEQPRQIIRDKSTGQFISNERVAETLPTYLIAMQSNTLIYNDVDVEAFNREVRQQAARILDAIKDEQFENAGIAYQQFIDQYDDCFEMPSPAGLADVRRRGIDLYAVLEQHGKRLAEDMSVKTLRNNNEKEVSRFYAITEAHINLFFYILMLNLALNNKIDSAQKQLRIKLGQLEKRLEDLLYKFIYANDVDYISELYKNNASNLYGWLLLKENDLNSALKIYQHDSDMHQRKDFNAVFKQVMNIYRFDNEIPARSIQDNALNGHGFSGRRLKIALRLCHYLEQTAQIRFYLDELTNGSENPETEDATVDVKSLLLPPTSLIATQ